MSFLIRVTAIGALATTIAANNPSALDLDSSHAAALAASLLTHHQLATGYAAQAPALSYGIISPTAVDLRRHPNAAPDPAAGWTSYLVNTTCRPVITVPAKPIPHPAKLAKPLADLSLNDPGAGLAGAAGRVQPAALSTGQPLVTIPLDATLGPVAVSVGTPVAVTCTR